MAEEYDLLLKDTLNTATSKYPLTSEVKSTMDERRMKMLVFILSIFRAYKAIS